MTENIKTGTKVSWDWGGGTAYGKVSKVFYEKVTRTIKDSEVTRNGSKDDPAYMIEQDNGDQLLKLRSELEAE